MSSPFVAEIRMFGGNFAPRSWAFCNGQLLPISQNTALFSLLGTFYGGDGRTTFGLPDLRDRTPLGPGQGPGLRERFLGETGGSSSVTLLSSELPAHSHNLVGASSPAGTTGNPAGLLPAIPGRRAGALFGPATAGQTTPMSFQALQPAGGSQPHNNQQPYLAVYFIIALQGVFPPRS